MSEKSHIFIESTKKHLKYCKNCNCLCLLEIPSKSLNTIETQNFYIDPMLLKYKQNKIKINYNNPYHLKYLEIRQIGINQIKMIINLFSVKIFFFYKALNYLDIIYLNNKEIFKYNIETVAKLCIYIAFQFNECCSKDQNDMCIKQFIRYTKNINNLIEMENILLKTLDYNLGIFNAYDYINLFFKLGFIFTKEKLNIKSYYNNCISMLNEFIDDKRYLDFNHYTLAMSIIKMNFSKCIFFDKKIFYYIFKVNFNKNRYKKCELVISSIIYNNYIMNNSSTYSNSNSNSKSTINDSLNNSQDKY